ncbi:MAG TPA: hypothetical protein GXX20_06540 [Clostridiaceae bacterium]|nr:hypothetical protein [Clostridiaceae bacterium]
MYLLGVDLGTTGCKSMVFDLDGSILAQNYTEYGLIIKDNSFIEQDADLWWKLVKDSIANSAKDLGQDACKIGAISVSSQGISFVPIDKEGKTLYNAINWLDKRASSQISQITDHYDEKSIFNITGKRLNAAYVLPKLMWVKENLPEVYNNTYKFLMGLDFITYKLSGKIITDHTMASGTLAFDINNRQWDSSLLEKFAIDIDKLPDLDYMGTCVGNILPEVAEELGLSKEVKIILGGQDQKCSAIGAAIADGITTVSLGTATAISTIFTKPALDPQMRIPCFCFDKDRWIIESVIGTSCVSLKWLRNTFFKEHSYKELDVMAERSLPGAKGVFFYPHLEGAGTPFNIYDMKGFMYGFTLSTSHEDVIRALMEGIAFQIKANVDVHEDLGVRINELRVFGGGSNSDIWCRIIADVTGKTVSVLYTSEIANLGAAVLAGVGAGFYKNYDDVLSNIKLVKKQYKPQEENMKIYSEVYEDYLKIQEKILKQ